MAEAPSLMAEAGDHQLEELSPGKRMHSFDKHTHTHTFCPQGHLFYSIYPVPRAWFHICATGWRAESLGGGMTTGPLLVLSTLIHKTFKDTGEFRDLQTKFVYS